jgi:hypothetical protein
MGKLKPEIPVKRRDTAMPSWRMKGEYLKNCNCAPSCACDTTSNPLPHAYCEGLVGMNIQEGNFEKVDLKGVKWVAAVHWPGAVHLGNGDVEVYVDEKASPSQRDSLLEILSGKAGGTYFEIVAAVAPNFKGVHFVPIHWQFDKGKRLARVSIPGFIETASEPLKIIPSGEEQWVIVRMPNGFEYKEMEVAQAVTLRSTGTIKFDWKGTHSSLAHVEQTNKGLVA